MPGNLYLCDAARTRVLRCALACESHLYSAAAADAVAGTNDGSDARSVSIQCDDGDDGDDVIVLITRLLCEWLRGPPVHAHPLSVRCALAPASNVMRKMHFILGDLYALMFTR